MGFTMKMRQVPVLVFLLMVCSLVSGQSQGQSQAQGQGSSSLGAIRAANKPSANSGEFDSVEALKIYTIGPDELIPTFAEKSVFECDLDYPFRSIDGTCNNVQNILWGKPNSTYLPLLPQAYADNLRKPRSGHDGGLLPPARKIRTVLFPEGTKENNKWNIFSMIWGQFMAHDMSLLKEPIRTSCCNIKKKPGRFCFPIKIPKDDPTMGAAGIRCLNFSRTVTDKDLGFGSPGIPAKQINTVSAYMDLSNVYGLSKAISDELRSFQGGKLKVEKRNNHIFPPRETELKRFCPCNLPTEKVCYKTGDSRSNQNPELALIQIMFVREHNRICDKLSAINSHWDDERLYQEARRILIAIYQRISYYEWLPIFNGLDNLLKDKVIYDEATSGFIDDYDSNKEPAITNEHAHGAFRYFHTHVAGRLRHLNPVRKHVNTFSLSNWFGRPGILESQKNNIEELTLGMTLQNIEETDQTFVKDIVDQFFACGKKFGIDLKSSDIQRDRDHGLAYYNDYRELAGLKRAESFDDYNDLISKDNIDKLKTLYEDYRDVDLSVGGSLEKHATGAEYGPTFLHLVNEQFFRTRVSDRFWYENINSEFTKEQLDEIRKATASRILCDSGDGIKDIQRIGFTLLFPGFNEILPCDKIPTVDLEAWREEPFSFGAGTMGPGGSKRDKPGFVNGFKKIA